MKKFIFTSIIISLWSISSSRVLADDHSHLLCNIDARSAFIHTHENPEPAKKAVALGGRVGCELFLHPHVSLHSAVYTSFDPGINHSNHTRVHPDFFDHNQHDYILLGEANINYQTDEFILSLGRQVFDSPHMDSDDLRMTQNLFEAYKLDYIFSDHIHGGVAYLRSMAGWENGIDQSHFVSIQHAMGGSGDGTYLVWAHYDSEYYYLHGWTYHIRDIENIFYVDTGLVRQINPAVSFEIDLQYDRGVNTGRASLGNIDAKTWGINTTLSYKNVYLSLRHNHNTGNTDALSSLGGGPFFTSMEDKTLDAIPGKDSKATVVSLEYQPMHALFIGSALGHFYAKDKQIFNFDEYDMYASYHWKEKLNIEIAYAHSHDRNHLSSLKQFRMIATLHY